jgi:hypothetical protein
MVKCPCGGEFKLSESILFDGTKPFPEETLEVQKNLEESLKTREETLKKRMKLATKTARSKKLKDYSLLHSTGISYSKRRIHLQNSESLRVIKLPQKARYDLLCYA